MAPHVPPEGTDHDSVPLRLANATPLRSPNAKVKHDVKNQLGIILGFSELMLADMSKDDPRRPDLTEIRGATVMAMQLVRIL